MKLDILLVAGRNSKWSPDLGRWVQGQCWLCWIADPRPHLVRVPDFALKTQIQAGERNIQIQVADWLGDEIYQASWRLRMGMENGETHVS